MSSRVFIVEDDRLVAMDLKRMLHNNGYLVAGVASSGEEALERVADLKPDLVLMDIVLEGTMDGISAAAAIHEGLEIPVLFLSAHSDPETVERAKGAGPSGYILKPVRERELHISMEMALYKREMECRLRESQEQQDALVQLFENFNEGILLLDPDGIIKKANAGFERLFLYSREEVQGKLLSEILVPPEQSFRFQDAVDEFSRKSLVTFESSRMRKDGEAVEVSVMGLPVQRNGKLVAMYAIYRDIREQAMLQRAILRTQRLDSIGLLAGGIAHDFNNIIAAVLGNIALARMHCNAGGQVLDFLVRAELAAVRARDLTGQLLTFSRVHEVEVSTIRLEKLLQETLDLALSGSTVVGTLDLEPGLFPVSGDEGQFSQIFNNLIINSKQAMPEGGAIRIRGRNRDDLDPNLLGEDLSAGKYVQITVCDDGPGIEEQVLAKIFDPYFTTKETGSGLGLAMVHFLVRQYHGLVTVDSRPGKGTCFTLYFPASSKDSAQSEACSKDVLRGQGRVLVMDDEPALLEVLCEILENLGYQAESVLNGDEAVQCYRAALEGGRKYDLVIMDLTVPGGMGGREAMAELRKLDPSVRAVVTSGYLHDTVMEQYEQYGFCAAIAKPYRIDELSQVLAGCFKDT